MTALKRLFGDGFRVFFFFAGVFAILSMLVWELYLTTLATRLTAQHFRRVVLNHKGVFTRTRDPKAAAWRLRQLWRGLSPGDS